MIAATLARLDDQVGALKQIGGAADFQAAAERNPNAEPAAFVFIVRESGGQSALVQRTRQKVAATLAVVQVVRSVADAKGAAAAAGVEVLRTATRAALLGWSPGEGVAPLEFDSGHLLSFRDGRLWWQDNYRTYYPLSSA